MKVIFNELNELWSSIDSESLELFSNAIAKSKKNIICLGAGRMGYAVQSFAMRLSHLGFNTYMIGDTGLPRIGDDDIVIINSSSGETQSVVLLAQLAKKHGARLFVITSNEKSTLANLSDISLFYKPITSSQLMKSAYEQFTFILFDHLSSKIFAKTGKDKTWVENNHSVLE